MAETGQKRNYIRRTFGGALCASPLVFATACAFWPTTTISPVSRVGGLALVITSCLFAILNFYLWFIRPRLWRLRHGTWDGYKYVSNVPGFGTLLQVGGCAIGFGSLPVGLIGIGSCLFDTGGLLWFAIATWNDSSLWDG